MPKYSAVAWERAMEIQEVILRAMAKKIAWWQAAEIIGISDRSIRRWRERYEEHGYDGLLDRRRGKPALAGCLGSILEDDHSAQMPRAVGIESLFQAGIKTH